MQDSKLCILLNMHSEVELTLSLFRAFSHKHRLPLFPQRFISINDAEQWLVEEGYNPQFYSVISYDDYLAGSRLYYSYHDKKYFDKYLNLMTRLEDMSQEEESQLRECIEHIRMIAITNKRKIILI